MTAAHGCHNSPKAQAGEPKEETGKRRTQQATDKAHTARMGNALQSRKVMHKAAEVLRAWWWNQGFNMRLLETTSILPNRPAENHGAEISTYS